MTSLRPPALVMRLARLGALQPCRLSFDRQLLRRIAAERWTVERRVWSFDASGRGHAVYSVATGGARRYGLVAVSAGGAKAGFALCDGDPTGADIVRLRAVLVHPDPVRVTERELCVTHATRDAALWDHVLARLATGRQPDPARLAAGALMQGAAVRASGKQGTADRDLIADRAEMHAPFQAELLTLWLIRQFGSDLVEHLAQASGGAAAARLTPEAAQALGVGLVAGMSLAAFPVTHPCLFNTWIMAREEAIARVAALDRVGPDDWNRVRDRLCALSTPRGGPSPTPEHTALHVDLAALIDAMTQGPDAPRPWARLMAWAEGAIGPDGQEALASAMLEPFGDLVDGLGHCMSDTLDRDYRIDGTVPVGRMRALIAGVHGWALARDWSEDTMTALAWSTALGDGEPTLGPRCGPHHRSGQSPTGPFELPLAVVHDAVRAWRSLGLFPDEMPVAQMLLDHPDHRSAIRRAQIAGFAPYAEIRDNLIDADLRPVDLMRATLAFIGGTDVNVPCDRRVRVRLFAGAPCADERRVTR